MAGESLLDATKNPHTEALLTRICRNQNGKQGEPKNLADANASAMAENASGSSS